jgi:uncharacterized protein (TIGR04255 family)
MSLEFSNLPLAEVVAKVVFAESLRLTFKDCAEVWKKVEEVFDDVGDLTGIETPPLREVTITPPSICGIRLIREGVMVALQNDLLAVRWNRSLGRVYPRYGALRDALWRVYDALRDTLGTTKTRVTIINMAYANFIFGDENLPRAVRGYLRPGILPAIGEAGDLNEINYSWRIPPATDFRVILNRAVVPFPPLKPEATSEQPESRPAFVLTTVSGVLLGENEEPRQALDRIHDGLQDLFLQVASEEALEEWGYDSGS